MTAPSAECVSTGPANAIQATADSIVPFWNAQISATDMVTARTELAIVDKVGLVTLVKFQPAQVIATTTVSVLTASATAAQDSQARTALSGRAHQTVTDVVFASTTPATVRPDGQDSIVR